MKCCQYIYIYIYVCIYICGKGLCVKAKSKSHIDSNIFIISSSFSTAISNVQVGPNLYTSKAWRIIWIRVYIKKIQNEFLRKLNSLSFY